MTPLSDSISELTFVPCFSPSAASLDLQKGESTHVSAPTRTEGHGACPRGWGEMFAEERPPPKKIYTPDGKYEFVEDGALGTGACGVVRIAKHLETGELYAIKIMSVTGRLSEFVKEMTAYGKVTGHPHVVSFAGACYWPEENGLAVATDFTDGGTLGGLLRRAGWPLPSRLRVLRLRLCAEQVRSQEAVDAQVRPC